MVERVERVQQLRPGAGQPANPVQPPQEPLEPRNLGLQLIPDIGVEVVGVEAAAFLSANDQEENVTKALTMGADDYIVKPFSSTELLARVASSLRKRRAAGAVVPRQPFQLEGLVIDYTDRNVTISGRPVRLSSTEYKLLFELSINAGRVLTRDQILRRVWA